MDKPTIKHQDTDDSDFTVDDEEMECQTCGGEYPNGCICYAKDKRPIWITN